MIKSRIVEFDWLKMAALLMLIFVHTNLYFDFPNIMQPVEWIMLSIFFFVSGYLAYDSFHKRGTKIRDFLKSKVRGARFQAEGHSLLAIALCGSGRLFQPAYRTSASHL